MDGKQSVVAVGGVGLVLANYWIGGARGKVSAGLFNPGGDVAGAHRQLVTFAGELLFVGVATVLAGVSDSWASAMVAVIVGLWILWAIHHYSGGQPAQLTVVQGGAAA